MVVCCTHEFELQSKPFLDMHRDPFRTNAQLPRASFFSASWQGDTKIFRGVQLSIPSVGKWRLSSPWCVSLCRHGWGFVRH